MSLKQVKTSSFTEDQPPGWNEKASKSHLGKPKFPLKAAAAFDWPLNIKAM